MGLRCSLLGHDFGPPETEREREERGDEVVITIRELQVCTRCGAERVTSESTEVRPVRPAPDSVTGEAEGEPAEPPEPTDAEMAAEEPSDPGEPEVEDDAVILEDDQAPSADRAPGQWPDAEDTRAGDDPIDPSAESHDEDDVVEATDQEPPDESESVESAEGDEQWPDPGPGEDEGYDATSPHAGEDAQEYVEAPEEGPDSGFVSPSEETVSVEEADAVFVCPSCDFREPVIGSSLRSGDICPSCKKGYLTERSS